MPQPGLLLSLPGAPALPHPPSFLFLYSPPPRAPSLIHPFTMRITGKLMKTQSAKCARCTFNLVHPESLICCEECCARISVHVLPSLFPHFLGLQLCQRFSLVASHLLTHWTLYIFSICIHTPLPPSFPLLLNLNGSNACCSLHATWS